MTDWYEIRVREVLSNQWSTWFTGMEIISEPEGSPGTGTLLSGKMLDQAALFGMLSLVRDLNLTLLEVRLVIDPTQRIHHLKLNE